MHDINVLVNSLGNEVASRVDLSERKLVVVLVVENVHQVRVERVNVIKLGKLHQARVVVCKMRYERGRCEYVCALSCHGT